MERINVKVIFSMVLYTYSGRSGYFGAFGRLGCEPLLLSAMVLGEFGLVLGELGELGAKTAANCCVA